MGKHTSGSGDVPDLGSGGDVPDLTGDAAGIEGGTPQPGRADEASSEVRADANTTLGQGGIFTDTERETPETVTVEVEKRHHGTRKVVTVVVVLLVLLACFIVAAGAFLSQKLHSMHTIGDPVADAQNVPGSQPAANDTGAINFLIMGSDSRISAGDPSQWKVGAQRTDAFMILQISGDRGAINVMSIPRDSWVNVPGYGMNKINAAYSFGGPALAIATAQQLTGIPISHFATIDFTSFVGLTDAVGGVQLNSVMDGSQTYNGKEALAFVRDRHDLPGGDFDRVRRQQAWIKAVLGKTLTKDVLSSPAKLMDLYNTVSPYIAIDSGFGLRDVLSLAKDMGNLGSADINFVTAPFTGTGRSPDGQSIVNLDETRLKNLCTAFLNDTADAYIKAHAQELRSLDAQPVQ
ncbi:MAG: LCP family protein [Actinomycetaceae bacterium]|nr:LCP family protein [Actinomycetaceae bacterium]MDY6082701.1 LCP family protein [Actinomycetaceae bacterium]